MIFTGDYGPRLIELFQNRFRIERIQSADVNQRGFNTFLLQRQYCFKGMAGHDPKADDE